MSPVSPLDGCDENVRPQDLADVRRRRRLRFLGRDEKRVVRDERRNDKAFGVLLPLLLLLASVARDEAEKCGVHRDKLLTIRRWAGL